MIRLLEGAQNLLDKTRALDFIGPLALRLYLVPVFLMAGLKKYEHFPNIVSWFKDGLGLPFPEIMAFLATATEIIGAIFLLIGFAVRWISIPLLITMFIAIYTVHWGHWHAIAPDSTESAQVLSRFMTWLSNNAPIWHQDLTKIDTPVMLQNGMELGVTYIVMLAALFFVGAGRYVSMDYWIKDRQYIPAIIVGAVLAGAFFFARHWYITNGYS